MFWLARYRRRHSSSNGKVSRINFYITFWGSSAFRDKKFWQLAEVYAKCFFSRCFVFNEMCILAWVCKAINYSGGSKGGGGGMWVKIRTEIYIENAFKFGRCLSLKFSFGEVREFRMLNWFKIGLWVVCGSKNKGTSISSKKNIGKIPFCHKSPTNNAFVAFTSAFHKSHPIRIVCLHNGLSRHWLWVSVPLNHKRIDSLISQLYSTPEPDSRVPSNQMNMTAQTRACQRVGAYLDSHSSNISIFHVTFSDCVASSERHPSHQHPASAQILS